MKIPFSIWRLAILMGLLAGEVQALSLRNLPEETLPVRIDAGEFRLRLSIDTSALAPGLQFGRVPPALAPIFDPSYVREFMEPKPIGPVHFGSAPIKDEDRSYYLGDGKFNFNIGYQF